MFLGGPLDLAQDRPDPAQTTITSIHQLLDFFLPPNLYKLVRFAHNWNNGILESWNDGFKENSNPLFHYSMWLTKK
jgi:hypothetical protein